MADDAIDPYELLGLSISATESEIKTAYRQRSLKVHPDRHRNNPDAAHKFHELNQAYELLLDPIRKTSLDAKVRAKLARKERFEKFDTKRKGMQAELEEAERMVKRAKMEKSKQERERKEEVERIKERGRQMRTERQMEMEREKEESATNTDGLQGEHIDLGPLDTTVRLKYPLSQHPELTTPASLSALLSTFGPVDEPAIVLSMKPLKKAPNKPPKQATALVPFIKIGDAHAAVSASGQDSKGLKNIEISWAGGKEPEVLDKLMRQDGAEPPNASHSVKHAPTPIPFDASKNSTPSRTHSPPVVPFDPLQTIGSDLGLDYESLTLMRLRKAERERLEREIREQEAES